MRFDRRGLITATGVAAASVTTGCIGGGETDEEPAGGNGGEGTQDDGENDGEPEDGEGDHNHDHDHEDDETEMTGGPNVHEGEPDADHVVDMEAVAFEPESITVSAGDTVAWVFADGTPHSVTAYDDSIPGDAEYWASGGFSSESAAREGWENGEGAVQEGEYYERTFETPGTHEYVCIPHEAAGMIGEVVVEEEGEG